MSLSIPTRGLRHVALRVRDLVPVVKEPRRHRDGSCSLYCSDPDGHVIQILYEPSISPLSFR